MNIFVDDILYCHIIVCFAENIPLDAISSAEQGCKCPCRHLKETPKEEKLSIEQKIERINKAMTIDRTLTANYQNRLVSVPDNRTSSVVIGGVGLAVVCCVIGGIVLMDLPHLVDAYRNIKHYITEKD